jgi:hypothetical protein
MFWFLLLLGGLGIIIYLLLDIRKILRQINKNKE